MDSWATSLFQGFHPWLLTAAPAGAESAATPRVVEIPMPPRGDGRPLPLRRSIFFARPLCVLCVFVVNSSLLPARTISCRVGIAPTERSRLGTAHQEFGNEADAGTRFRRTGCK